MNIAQAIIQRHPNAVPSVDFSVRDEGDGQYIAYWNEAKLGPRPTDQQIRGAWIPALKAQKIAEVRRRVVSECESLMPVYEMLYCIRARINDPRLTTVDGISKKGRDMETWINDPARTEAQLQAVSWDTWV